MLVGRRAMSVAVLGVLALAGCGKGATVTEGTPAGPTVMPLATEAAPDTSSGDTSSSSPKTTTSEVALLTSALVSLACETAAQRMGPEAEQFTKESYECSRKGEQVRIDLFESIAEQTKAAKIVLDYYESVGDPRALKELPLICGDRWVIGVDFNETRDALIDLFVGRGIAAATC